VGHSPITPNSARGSIIHSRPTSVYSTHTQSSSEDVRSRDSRHNSLASVGSHMPDHYAYPVWATNNPNSIPPVPMIPAFVMEMPLLPPTAPFMLQKSPRQRSPGPPSSPSKSRVRTNSSSEHLRIPRDPSAPIRPQYHSNPSSASSSPHRQESQYSHHRRRSGDARRSSVPQQNASWSQPISISRGRSGQSASSQPPSPWTGLPSQSGQIPVGMPTYGLTPGSQSRSSSTRRRTALM